MHKIEVRLKPHLPDPAGKGLVKDIQDLGINSVTDARIVDIYWLDANLAPEKLESIAADLLADKVTQDYVCGNTEPADDTNMGYRVVEVAYNAGSHRPGQRQRNEGH